MLSDEEKKVYEEAKLYLTHTGVDDFNLEKHQSENRIWAMDTLLNLIEKQSKEIEELKEVKWYYEISRVPKDKIKAILEEYKYTEIGDSEKIIEFYKKIQSLLEKE